MATEKMTEDHENRLKIQESNRSNFEKTDAFQAIDSNLRSFLNSINDTPTVQKAGGIGVLMEEALAQNKDNPKEALKQRLKALVLAELQRWAEENLKAVQTEQRRSARDAAMAENPQYSGGIFSTFTKATEWLGSATSTGAVSKYEHLAQNPFLFSVLGKDLSAKVEAQLQTGNFNPDEYESFVDQGVEGVLSKTSFEAIYSNYHQLVIEKGSDKDIDVLVSKLEGIGEEYWGSKWEKNYKKYVEGTGPSAMEFDEWIGNQDMGAFEQLKFMFKRLFGSFSKMENSHLETFLSRKRRTMKAHW
ncbi:hypothetical protein HC823_00910 [Candidatus Gracilibacteria bacterium]|nr:hypothetical protein [Candidatus Gracilibacteria bacterium]